MGLHWLRGNLFNLFKLRKYRTDWRPFLSLKSRNGVGLTLDKGQADWLKRRSGRLALRYYPALITHHSATHELLKTVQLVTI